MAKVDLRNFDYKKLAEYDTEMWRAYYNHQFFKLFWQLLRLMRGQFGFSWFLTVRLAYHAGWAAADYRIYKKKGTNNQRILNNLAHFYKIISDHSTNPFDYKKAARLELAWWEVHRRSYKNNDELEQSLADAAAVLYGVEPANLDKYAHYRAEAMILPRHESDKQEVPTDWEETERLLVKSWRSLHSHVQQADKNQDQAER